MSGATNQALLMVGEDKDPFYAQVKVLTHLDGTIGTNTIIDNSPVPFATTDWLRSGSPLLSATGRFNQGLSLVSSTAYLDNRSGLNPGANDWTIEHWSYLESTASFSNGVIIAAWLFTSFLNNPIVTFQTYTATTTTHFYAVEAYINSVYTNIPLLTQPVQFDQWVHLAATRQGNTFRVFINGVLVYTGTMLGTFGTSGAKFQYGSQFDAKPNKWLDEVRLTVGVARYTANFAPPSKPFPNS